MAKVQEPDASGKVQLYRIRWTDLDTGETGLVLRDGVEPTERPLERAQGWAARFNAASAFFRCEVEPALTVIELRPEPATLRDMAALVIERAAIALVEVHEVDLEGEGSRS